MPSTLSAVVWPDTSGLATGTWHTIHTALNGASDKNTLITGLRIVNVAGDGLSVQYDLELNGKLLMKDAHVQNRGAEDLCPGGTTMVLNKGNTIRIKVGTSDGIHVHLDIIERT